MNSPTPRVTACQHISGFPALGGGRFPGSAVYEIVSNSRVCACGNWPKWGSGFGLPGGRGLPGPQGRSGALPRLQGRGLGAKDAPQMPECHHRRHRKRVKTKASGHQPRGARARNLRSLGLFSRHVCRGPGARILQKIQRPQGQGSRIPDPAKGVGARGGATRIRRTSGSACLNFVQCPFRVPH